MAPNPVNLQGLVIAMAPNPMNLKGLVIAMAPNQRKNSRSLKVMIEPSKKRGPGRDGPGWGPGLV